MKNINWKIRIGNIEFWKALVPALILLLQAIAAVFGFTLDLGDIGNKLLAVIEAVFLVLAILGIINDPTTDGLKDSNRAMGYQKPYKEVIDNE